LSIFLENNRISKEEGHSEEEIADNCAKFLRSLVDDAHLVLAKGNLGKLLDHRVILFFFKYSNKIYDFYLKF